MSSKLTEAQKEEKTTVYRSPYVYLFPNPNIYRKVPTDNAIFLLASTAKTAPTISQKYHKKPSKIIINKS